MRRLERGLREQDAVVRYDSDGVAMEVRKALQDQGRQGASMGEGEVVHTVTMVVPYSFLNSRKRLPSTMRAMTSRMSKACRRSVPTIPWSSEAGYSGSSGTAGGCSDAQCGE